MEIKWTEQVCDDVNYRGFSVWRDGELGTCQISVCKSRSAIDAPWLGSARVHGPYINVDVHRATEAEALADVLDLARRCGMVAE